MIAIVSLIICAGLIFYSYKVGIMKGYQDRMDYEESKTDKKCLLKRKKNEIK
jgi:hypothetical protein